MAIQQIGYAAMLEQATDDWCRKRCAAVERECIKRKESIVAALGKRKR